MILESRQQLILQTLRRVGRLSRWELHDHTGIRPNTVGSDVGQLLAARIVSECEAEAEGRGRPRIPLEIDTEHRRVLGMAIRPGHVAIQALNLLGQPVGVPARRDVAAGERMTEVAVALLRSQMDESTLTLGVSTPGFVDAAGHRILFSSAAQQQGREPTDVQVNLQAIYDVAGDMQVALENDMHALAARWLFTHEQEQGEDVVLAYFDDGQLGAAILINGRPNRGCVIGGNELGHTRLPVETDPCYCGHSGCLERIVSTSFLHRLNGKGKGDKARLGERAARYDGADKALEHMIDLLSTGLANAVNFMRPARLVLVSDLMKHKPFANAILDATRRKVLAPIAERAKFESWEQAATNAAENAGWLALANFYYKGWDQPAPPPGEPRPDHAQAVEAESP